MAQDPHILLAKAERAAPSAAGGFSLFSGRQANAKDGHLS
jgi:hypothetical protein